MDILGIISLPEILSVLQPASKRYRVPEIGAKLVPKNLSKQQKNNRKAVCFNLRERVENDPTCLKYVITGDEFWISEYDQTSKWAITNAQLNASKESKKGYRDVVHKEFVSGRQKVNEIDYSEVLERLRTRIIRIHPEIADSWMLYYNNALCHTALSVNVRPKKVSMRHLLLL